MWSRVASSTFWMIALLLSVGRHAAGQSAVERTSSRPLPGRVVDVKAAEFFFQAPDTIPAGLTTFRLLQTGFVVERLRAGGTTRDVVADKGDNTRGMHMLWVVRLDSGKTLTDLYRAAQARERMSAWARQLGGPGFTFPPATTNATIDLEPGNYALVCYVGSAHENRARYHLMNGMFRALTVMPSAQPRSAPPQVDVVATIREGGVLAFSNALAPGRVVIRVDNETDVDWEFKFQRVPRGMTGKGYLAQPAGTGSRMPAGGLSSVPPRSSVITTLNFTAGDYVAGTHMAMRHRTSQVVTVAPRTH